MNRLRILFIVVAGLFGFLLAGCNSSSENVNGWQADKELVAKQYRHGSDFNYDESKVPDYVLPELLTAKDGSKIRSSKKWEEIRRNEILELFRDNVYGRVPATSYNETFNVVEKDNNALNGTAVYKHIEIAIAKNPDTLIINLLLFTPKRNEPSPVFLLICNRDKNNIDPTRVHKSPFWPVEEIIAGGYGAAAFFNGDVDPDNYDEFKNGIHGMLDEGRRESCSWGTLAAWAWGAGKCMDYLVTDSDVDKNKVAVLGHSRGGKTALWAGAEDQRFGMVISNESGCGGAALARRKYGETIKRIIAVR